MGHFLIREPRKPFGRLAGKVQDARSGMPLDAKVMLSGARSGAVKTDPRTGVFFIQKAPVGVTVVEASKEGYIPEAVPMVIVDGGFATYTFNLKPLVPYGTVAGRVTDVFRELIRFELEERSVSLPDANDAALEVTLE